MEKFSFFQFKKKLLWCMTEFYFVFLSIVLLEIPTIIFGLNVLDSINETNDQFDFSYGPWRIIRDSLEQQINRFLFSSFIIFVNKWDNGIILWDRFNFRDCISIIWVCFYFSVRKFSISDNRFVMFWLRNNNLNNLNCLQWNLFLKFFFSMFHASISQLISWFCDAVTSSSTLMIVIYFFL